MKTTHFSLLLAAGASHATPLEPRASGVQGFDISSYQGSVDFSAAYAAGARFVIIKVRQNIWIKLSHCPLDTLTDFRPPRALPTLIHRSQATTQVQPTPA